MDEKGEEEWGETEWRMGRDRMCVELISKFFKKPTTISLCLGYYNT
jgi:hypothetical protein